MRSTIQRPPGFTMIEILAVLGIIAVLAAVTAPSIVKHITDSKIARAQHDVEVIATSMAGFYKDLGRWPTDNDGDFRPQDQEVRLLWTVSGDTPAQVGGAGWTNLNPRDTFENQLILNEPGGVPANAYPSTGDNCWNGPYALRFKCDPWGHQYLCNVRGFHLGQAGPVWVISAGPDGRIDSIVTDFNMSGDDIGYMLRR